MSDTTPPPPPENASPEEAASASSEPDAAARAALKKRSTSRLLATQALFQLSQHASETPEAVVRQFGESPLRQFLIPGPRGSFQATELAFDPHRGDWFDVYGAEDRRPGEWGHWSGRGMNWNSMCASCHNTRLRKNYDAKTDTYATAMAEMLQGGSSSK